MFNSQRGKAGSNSFASLFPSVIINYQIISPFQNRRRTPQKKKIDIQLSKSKGSSLFLQNYLPNDLISPLKLTRAFKKMEVQQVKIEENVEPGDEVTHWGDTGPCRVVGLCSWEMFNLRNALPVSFPNSSSC